MAEKNNANCSICGKAYYVCRSCKDNISLSPWKLHTDTAEHYKIFQIVRGLSTGLYTKDEAREKLNNVDLSDLESLRDNIKKIIKDIMMDEQDVSTQVDQNVVVQTTIVQDNNMLEKPIVTRKKKSSKTLDTEQM